MKKGSGMNTLIAVAAVAGGGYLLYKFLFEKKALASRVKGPADNTPMEITLPSGQKIWYGAPATPGGNYYQVSMNPDMSVEAMGPPPPQMGPPAPQ